MGPPFSTHTQQSRLDDIDARIKAAGTQTVVQLGPGEVTAQLALIANALYQRVTFQGPCTRLEARRFGNVRALWAGV